MARTDNYHTIKGCLSFLYAIKTIKEKGIYNSFLIPSPYVIENQWVMKIAPNFSRHGRQNPAETITIFIIEMSVLASVDTYSCPTINHLICKYAMS